MSKKRVNNEKDVLRSRGKPSDSYAVANQYEVYWPSGDGSIVLKRDSFAIYDSLRITSPKVLRVLLSKREEQELFLNRAVLVANKEGVYAYVRIPVLGKNCCMGMIQGANSRCHGIIGEDISKCILLVMNGPQFDPTREEFNQLIAFFIMCEDGILLNFLLHKTHYPTSIGQMVRACIKKDLNVIKELATRMEHTPVNFDEELSTKPKYKMNYPGLCSGYLPDKYSEDKIKRIMEFMSTYHSDPTEQHQKLLDESDSVFKNTQKMVDEMEALFKESAAKEEAEFNKND